MKTILLLVLFTIASSALKKGAGAEMPKHGGKCITSSTAQAAGKSKCNASLEMPNNWNVKVIE